MRFLADMGVSATVVRWLQEYGHDATHLRDQGLQRLADPEIFRKAVEEDRIILTFDLDFGEIVALSQFRECGVVFRLRNTRSAHVIARLEAVLGASASELHKGAVIVVEESRHRVRRPPIGRD